MGGDAADDHSALLAQLGGLAPHELLWVAAQAPPGVVAVPVRQVDRHLGSECRLLVYDAHQGLHPDALAAAIGTLRGGGDCVLLAPPLDRWAGFADPDQARFTAYPREPHEMRGLFLQRLARIWRGLAATCVVPVGDTAQLRLAPRDDGDWQLNADQQAVVAAVERVARGHARRPLVLTADRGRGKSTALGVAAARLLLDGLPRITVVAAHRGAAEALFRHAARQARLAEHGVADRRIGKGELRFRLPIDCLDGSETGLVIVEEAAALPGGVLEALLGVANRLVFATTVHGYEGSGRGFDLRFSAVLDRVMPQWHAMRLDTPVRWPVDDPLEEALNLGLLLDVEMDAVAGSDGVPQVQRVGADELVADEALLRSVFGLLVSAHYQTRPSDLRQLLDNPDTHLWIAREGTAVVGVLLGDIEGAIDPEMAALVVAAQRRPRGHLLPQSLAVHAGLDEALALRVLRVQRIAVHPARRRRGIGRRLLRYAADWAAAQGLDLLGCVFAADLPLFAFWRADGLAPVRLGNRVDPASAAHSLFMLRGLSAAGAALCARAAVAFRADLPWSLGGDHRTLDPTLAAELLHGRECRDLEPGPSELVALQRIAVGARAPATATAAVWKALVGAAARGAACGAELAPLIAWWLQHRPGAVVCAAFGLSGRRVLETRLRSLLAAEVGRSAIDG